MLTREDANSESALVAEWLVDDGAEVRKGKPLCVIETSKASIEIPSPGDGTLVQLVAEGVESEIGACIALVAESAEELASARATRETMSVAEVAEEEPAVRNATRKAVELAERAGVDLAQIDKTGFITAEDVEAFTAAGEMPSGKPERDALLAGLSTDGVSLPAVFETGEDEGVLDEEFLASLCADLDAFAALPSGEKCEAYRRHGARIGEGVTFGEGAVVAAPRIVLEDGVSIGAGGRLVCEEVFAAGELAKFGRSFVLGCRRAFVGAGFWSGAGIRIGGGGHRDPWATFAMGELGFIGDEAFVNVCRPVLIGAEVFVTMRSLLLTHNIGHSVLEGFENRFAGIVIEDRAQIGVGAVVYAGCRIGREAIVASNSYVVADVPPEKLAVGVPARIAGAASRPLTSARQLELARRMIDELAELLALRGIDTEELRGDGVHGLELTGAEGPGRVLLVETVTERFVPKGNGETVVLTLGMAGDPPSGCAVLDLLGRRVHGDGGALLDTAREFCRKRGIRFEPGPWRYAGGLI